MRVIELTDTNNESSYLRRLLTKEVERLQKWMDNPVPGTKRSALVRMEDDLETAASILRKLEQRVR